MSDLGPIQKHLGVEFVALPEGMLLHQRSYLLKVLEDFDMTHCHSAAIPISPGAVLTEETGSPDIDATYYWRLVGKL
jgi:hypothetical protein